MSVLNAVRTACALLHDTDVALTTAVGDWIQDCRHILAGMCTSPKNPLVYLLAFFFFFEEALLAGFGGFSTLSLSFLPGPGAFLAAGWFVLVSAVPPRS